MLILRKYSRLNKIKNRYIITMVYKSKKLNKRRYFKRQSRKLIKRGMYGGVLPKSSDNISIENQEKDIPLNNEKKDKIAADEIMKEIEENNKLELPNLTEIPVAGPIMESAGNLIETSAVKGLDVLGNSIGVDINNPASIGEKLDDIKDAVSSPENIQKTKEILANAGEYVGLVVDAAAPVVDKVLDKTMPIITEQGEKLLEKGMQTGKYLVTDIMGEFATIPLTMASAAEATLAATNAASTLIKGTSEAIQGTQQNLNRLIDENNLKMSNVKIPNVKMPNVAIPDVKMPNPPQMPNTPQMPNMNNNSYRQQGGGLLKKYQKEKMMIGGRISQSQSEFLGGQLFSSQNLQQYGGKWHTKRRHYLKRKMTSRSYK